MFGNPSSNELKQIKKESNITYAGEKSSDIEDRFPGPSRGTVKQVQTYPTSLINVRVVDLTKFCS